MTNDFIMQMKPWFGAEERGNFILYGRRWLYYRVQRQALLNK